MATLAGMEEAWLPLLALDTSTETMAVALHGPLGVRLHEGPGGAQASQTLLPRIQAMLREQGLSAAAVRAVAFGRGPGAFTGLRTACAVAQGLALGAGCSVVPVDSLMLVAEDAAAAGAAGEVPREPALAGQGVPHPGQAWQAPAVGTLAAVAMDARMGEVYAALYRWSGLPGTAGWEVVQPACLCEPQVLARDWPGWLAPGAPARWVAGSGLALLAAGTVPAGTQVRTGPSRAAALLRLATRLRAADGACDPAQALPVYLRDKVALTVAERAAAAFPLA